MALRLGCTFSFCDQSFHEITLDSTFGGLSACTQIRALRLGEPPEPHPRRHTERLGDVLRLEPALGGEPREERERRGLPHRGDEKREGPSVSLKVFFFETPRFASTPAPGVSSFFLLRPSSAAVTSSSADTSVGSYRTSAATTASARIDASPAGSKSCQVRAPETENAIGRRVVFLSFFCFFLRRAARRRDRLSPRRTVAFYDAPRRDAKRRIDSARRLSLSSRPSS